MININGKLISEESFDAVRNDYQNEDKFVASLSNNNSRFQKSLYGLIDAKGNWLMSPSYHTLDPIGKDNYIAQINGRMGIINSKNKELLRFQFNKIIPFRDGMVYANSTINGKDNWQLLRPNDYKVIQSGLQYKALYPVDMKGKQYFIAESNEGELWLDNTFRSLLPRPYTRVFTDYETNTVDGYDSKGSNPETQKFTHHGKLITFNINGTLHSKYRQYIKPDSLFSYIYLNDGNGYYFLPDKNRPITNRTVL